MSMTPDQRFTLIMSGIGLLFTILCVIIGLIWRAATKVGETTSDLKDVALKATECMARLDQHIQWHMGQFPGRK